MRLTVNLEPDLYASARSLAKAEDVSWLLDTNLTVALVDSVLSQTKQPRIVQSH